jgi:hypothetical protein
MGNGDGDTGPLAFTSLSVAQVIGLCGHIISVPCIAAGLRMPLLAGFAIIINEISLSFGVLCF